MSNTNVYSMEDHEKWLSDLRDDYRDLYEDLLSQGKNIEDATHIVKHLRKSEEVYMDQIEGEKIQNRLQFTVKWLERNFKWKSLNKEQKTDLLFILGMDVKGGSKKWHVREERARDEGGKSVDAYLQQIVWGDERLDWEWLNSRRDDFSHYASEEARDWRRVRSGGVLRKGQ